MKNLAQMRKSQRTRVSVTCVSGEEDAVVLPERLCQTLSDVVPVCRCERQVSAETCELRPSSSAMHITDIPGVPFDVVGVEGVGVQDRPRRVENLFGSDL